MTHETEQDQAGQLARGEAIPIFLPPTEPDAREAYLGKGVQAGFHAYLDRANQESSDAQAVVAYMYLNRMIGDGDFLDKALFWARKSAERRNRYGLWVLAWAEFESMDISEGLEALSKSAAQEFPPALFDLGTFCINGIILPRNWSTGITLLRKAAGLGHRVSRRTLDVCRKLGMSGFMSRIATLVTQPFLAPLRFVVWLIFARKFTEGDLIYLRQLHVTNEIRRGIGNEAIGKELETRLENELRRL